MSELCLRITQCPDPMMWYRGHVGSLVPFLYEEDGSYWSAQKAGYKNIVWKEDAEIISVESPDYY